MRKTEDRESQLVKDNEKKKCSSSKGVKKSDAPKKKTRVD